MNKARTGIVGDMVTCQHGDFMIPEAFGPVCAVKRVFEGPTGRIDIRHALIA